MELELNTWQRLMCIQALNARTGHISMLHRALKLLDVLALSEEERQAVGYVELPDGSQRWADPARRWTLQLPDGELTSFLQESVKQFNGWPVEQAAEALDLFERLGIDST